MASSVLDEINSTLSEIGFCLIHQDEMSERQRRWVFSEEGQEFNKQFLESQQTVDRVAEAIRRSVGRGVLKDLYLGQTDAVKQKALYVDFDIAGNLKGTPQDISEDVARQYIDYAKRAIERIGIVDDRTLHPDRNEG